MQLRHLLRFALAALEQRRRQQRAGWRSGQRGDVCVGGVAYVQQQQRRSSSRCAQTRQLQLCCSPVSHASGLTARSADQNSCRAVSIAVHVPSSALLRWAPIDMAVVQVIWRHSLTAQACSLMLVTLSFP